MPIRGNRALGSGNHRRTGPELEDIRIVGMMIAFFPWIKGF
jgi:hypothetical protein